MKPTQELVEQARESEVKAVMETMKALDPIPGEEPDATIVFEQSAKSLFNQDLVRKIDNGGVEITTKGQIVLSIMMARTESISEFIMTLNMGAEDTMKSLSDVENRTNTGPLIDRLMDHIGSGQPGLLVNLFSFLIYRSIVIANDYYQQLDQDDGGDGIIH